MDKDVLYNRLEKLYWYVCNRYGWQCPLLDVISERINILLCGKAYADDEEIIEVEPVAVLLAEVV